MINKVDRSFYNRDTLVVAKELLGKYLVHKVNGDIIAGKIVETEAYMGPHDKAAHSYNNRRTERNEVMYGPPGFAYVYIIYGMYNCMNVVTMEQEKPEAVLIRALEPVSGIENMSTNRYKRSLDELSRRTKINLTNGPGKLCDALNIDRKLNGEDLCKETLYITEGIESLSKGEFEKVKDVYKNISYEDYVKQNSSEETFDIISSRRINIDYSEEAAHFPWRFYIKGNMFVSKA